MDIFISKTILNNEEIDDSTLATYVALRSIFDLNRPIKYVTDNMLCYELFGNTSYTKYTKQAIKKGLDNLAAMNLITVTESIGKSEWLIDMTNLYIPDGDYYVILADTEVHTILNADKVDKFLLLRYFACIIGTIDYNSHIYSEDFEDQTLNNFVGYMTMEYIGSLARVPKKTVVTYNEVLESLKLIYVYRHEKYNVEGTGEIRSFSNHYGRYCYEKYIKQFALQYEESTGEGKRVIEAKKDANKRRSLTQKYNAFVNGADYTTDEVIDLYTHVLEHNEKYQKIIDGSLDSDAIAMAEKEIKDVTAFEEYFNVYDLDAYFNVDLDVDTEYVESEE